MHAAAEVAPRPLGGESPPAKVRPEARQAEEGEERADDLGFAVLHEVLVGDGVDAGMASRDVEASQEGAPRPLERRLVKVPVVDVRFMRRGARFVYEYDGKRPARLRENSNFTAPSRRWRGGFPPCGARRMTCSSFSE